MVKKNESDFDLSKVIRGTIIERYVKCKRKQCECHKGNKIHGPNYYLVYRELNKTKHIYLPKNKVDIVKEYINNYKDLKRAITKFSKENIKRIKESE